MERPSLRKRQLEKEMGETLYTEDEVSELMESERTYQAERYAELERRYKELEQRNRELNPPEPKQTDHPIFAAIASNDLEAVGIILAEEPYATDTRRARDNYLPIHAAVETGNLAMVKLFTELGVSPYFRPHENAESPTALDLAALRAYPEMFTYLRSIQRGSYFNIPILDKVLKELETTTRVAEYLRMIGVLIREGPYGGRTTGTSDPEALVKSAEHWQEFLTRHFAPYANKGRRFSEAYALALIYFEELTGRTMQSVLSEDAMRKLEFSRKVEAVMRENQKKANDAKRANRK